MLSAKMDCWRPVESWTWTVKIWTIEIWAKNEISLQLYEVCPDFVCPDSKVHRDCDEVMRAR